MQKCFFIWLTNVETGTQCFLHAQCCLQTLCKCPRVTCIFHALTIGSSTGPEIAFIRWIDFLWWSVIVITVTTFVLQSFQIQVKYYSLAPLSFHSYNAKSTLCISWWYGMSYVHKMLLILRDIMSPWVACNKPTHTKDNMLNQIHGVWDALRWH